MKESIEKILMNMQEVVDDTMEDYYNTCHKLIRLFKLNYQENTILYKTILQISTQMYPCDIRNFLDIYNELSVDEDDEQTSIEKMQIASKLTNRVSNRNFLELQLEEQIKFRNEIDVMGKVMHELLDMIEDKIDYTQNYHKFNLVDNQDKITYH